MVIQLQIILKLFNRIIFMKEYIFFIIFIICTNSVYAQVPIDESAKNEMKYWKLRGRLIGDDNNKDVYNGFMTVGSGDGMSIPAATRAPFVSVPNFRSIQK